MNKLIALGNLGHAASVRDVVTKDGLQPVVNFSIGVRVGWGEDERTQWYGCHWWGHRAAKVAQWMTKGRRVLVEGEPELRMFAKRDKTAGAEITVRVINVTLLDGAKEREEGSASGAAGNAAADTQRGPAVEAAAKSAADEDVPF